MGVLQDIKCVICVLVVLHVMDYVCVWQKLKNQIILLFSLFLLLLIGSIAFFGTIHGSYCTISANFYLYLQFFH